MAVVTATAGAARAAAQSPVAKVRISAPGPFARSTAAVELHYLSSRHTPTGGSVAAAPIANATFSARLTPSFEPIATVRNLFNQPYADPASEEHLSDAIQQNGRTARIGLRWGHGSK